MGKCATSVVNLAAWGCDAFAQHLWSSHSLPWRGTYHHRERSTRALGTFACRSGHFADEFHYPSPTRRLWSEVPPGCTSTSSVGVTPSKGVPLRTFRAEILKRGAAGFACVLLLIGRCILPRLRGYCATICCVFDRTRQTDESTYSCLQCVLRMDPSCADGVNRLHDQLVPRRSLKLGRVQVEAPPSRLDSSNQLILTG